MVDWTQVAIAAITTLGGVVSAVFATRAGTHAVAASASADRAVAASLRPPADVDVTPTEGARK